MTRLPKFFLTLSVAAFAAGAIACFGSFELHPSWMVAMPAGAIFFGLFLNAYVLQGEVAKFNEETTPKPQADTAKKEADSKVGLDSGQPLLNLGITGVK